MADETSTYSPDKTLPKRARTIMIVALFGSNLLASFMQSLMNVALDVVAKTFHITLSQANWMVLGYTIVTATVITMAASLLKRYGLRVVFFAGYAFALVGSLVGFFAVNYPMMVVARLLQAVTTGLYFPLITEALLALAPKGQAGKLLTINSGVIGFGLAFAPPLSGLIITYVGLKVLFLIPAFMAIVLAVVGHFAIHDLFPRIDRRIDVPSVLLSFAGLASFMYGLNEIAHDLFPPLVFLLVGIVVLGVFVWRQLHLKEPLLDLRPFGNRVYSIGEIVVFISYMASVCMSLLLPLYLEDALGFTPFITGCLCITPIVCYAISCPIGGKLLAKKGIWPLMPVGLGAILLGYAITYFSAGLELLAVVIVGSSIAYIGVGFVFPPTKSVDLESLSLEMSPHGSAIHSTIVQISGSIASALFVGVLSGNVDHMMTLGLAESHAYVIGFSNMLLIAMGIVIVALIVSFVFVRVFRKAKAEGLQMPKSK